MLSLIVGTRTAGGTEAHPRDEAKKQDFASNIRQCSDLATLRLLHAQITASGHHRRPFLGNLLVQMYGKCGSIEDARAAFAAIASPNIYSWTILVAAHVQASDLCDARAVFDAMPSRDVVAWNSIIGGYARRGHCGEAIDLFCRMDLDGVRADAVTFLAMLDACARQGCLELAREIHEIVIEERCGSDSKIRNSIVNMYGKCGGVEEARRAFDSLEEKTVIGWTAVLTAYAQNGHLAEARETFAAMPERNVVSWNAILSANAQQGNHREALELFFGMNSEGIQASAITIICVLDAAASAGDLDAGIGAHAIAIEAGLAGEMIVANALLHLYGECGELAAAEAMFAALGDRHRRNTMSWNVMISARARVDPAMALETFWAMNLEGSQRPNVVTFVSVMDACANSSNLAQGKLAQAHSAALLPPSVILATAVVTMYGRCGRIDTAREVFDGISLPDVIAWSAMLTAYSQNGHGKEALAVLAEMDVLGLKPSAVTYVSAVDACVSLESIRTVHDGIVDAGFQSNGAVASALVHAYGRSGALPDAAEAFRTGPLRDAALWNALIAAFARNELAGFGVAVFREMVADGVAPNEITFVSVLCCCGHAGLLEDVWSCFVGMIGDHGVVPGVDHYACVVDLLGRAGRLTEAEDLMASMPFEPDFAAWTSFLDSCKSSGARTRSFAAANALVVDPSSSGPYVLLSNMHKHS
ncbi:pentatricopeptide repeat-containing protein At2g29760, chloroplastic [Selaginella moellendorffii]|nr:pentatricopeptide repeat-containing protein At2g29760, chloroplastic [Selaginella moellendorffii]|eukprot:XP_002978804.2 pentatricopeptide repeat-containing protein At2g29760, chloroplastic [Selaginella moellendorffii]